MTPNLNSTWSICHFIGNNGMLSWALNDIFCLSFCFGTFVFPSIIIFSVESFDSDFFNSINLPSLTLFFFSLCDIKARRRIATLTLSKQKAYNENPYKLPFDFYTHFKFGSIILIVHLNLWFIWWVWWINTFGS